MSNPLSPFLDQQGVLILDGGLATELEARGYDLNDDLWSARALMERPDLIRRVHSDYLDAGADCIVSASYQATPRGFMRRGLSQEEAADLLVLSVRLAIDTRDEFWADPVNRTSRIRPIVAASVGPYGAYLADGSEYTGDYDIGESALTDFHRERWRILVESGADVFACETIPSIDEALALMTLLSETPQIHAWFSFSCVDETRVSDGTKLAELAVLLDDSEQVVAIGVNCTSPRFISSLVAEMRGVTDKSIIIYPNSGERFEPSSRQWSGADTLDIFAELSVEWRNMGASIIGGCCRTGPAQIAKLRRQLL
jgi:homocysteine S-methyltransferase